MLKPTIFREYDIRGAADVELLDADVETLGQACGTYLQRHAGTKVNLGRDTRLSSPRLRDALMRGLKASGCEVTDLGVVPTPVLYYSVFHLKADGAVMITGSHNPPEFNGFKVVCGDLDDSRRSHPGDPPRDRNRRPGARRRQRGNRRRERLPMSPRSAPNSNFRAASGWWWMPATAPAAR